MLFVYIAFIILPAFGFVYVMLEDTLLPHERRRVLKNVCNFFSGIGRNHPLILGNNNENLPRIISIIGEALSREAVEEESDCYPRLINIVRQLQVSRC